MEIQNHQQLIDESNILLLGGGYCLAHLGETKDSVTVGLAKEENGEYRRAGPLELTIRNTSSNWLEWSSQENLLEFLVNTQFPDSQ